MREFLFGILILFSYFIVCATVALVLRKTIKIPNEVFRKTLHFILLFSLLPFVYAFEVWWHSCIACILVIVLAYPILFFFERFKSYSETVTERKKGELRSSLILVFLMFAFVIFICRGVFENPELTFAVIYSWGFGDAFAALIGTKFGKHKIYRKKSFEGSLAMFLTSFLVVFIILLIGNLAVWYFALIVAIVVALAVSVVELFTPNGLDTVTCPLSSLAVMVPLLLLLGGIAL